MLALASKAPVADDIRLHRRYLDLVIFADQFQFRVRRRGRRRRGGAMGSDDAGPSSGDLRRKREEAAELALVALSAKEDPLAGQRSFAEA